MLAGAPTIRIHGQDVPVRAEIARLKRELDRTRQERDVLKKAIAIFSEAPR